MPHAEDKMPFYALGTNLALQADDCVPFTNLKSVLEPDELEVVIDAFCTLFRATSGSNRDKKPDDERMSTILNTYGPQFNVILNQRMGRISETIQKEGQAFVTRYCQEHKTNVIVTDSGLVYHEVVAGTGKSPTLESTVEVHYHGTLTDGTIVDSSVVRDETATFPLNAVIPGWTEGLQRMKEGGTRNEKRFESNQTEATDFHDSSPCCPVRSPLLFLCVVVLVVVGFLVLVGFLRSSHVDPSVRLGLWKRGFRWHDSTRCNTSI
jgi:FKBP-type peptidyl-prolyl cis-trans isomerase